MNIPKSKGMNIPKTHGMNIAKGKGMGIKTNKKGMDIKTSGGMRIGKDGDYSQVDEYARIRGYLSNKTVNQNPERRQQKAQVKPTTKPEVSEEEVISEEPPVQKLFSSLQSIKRTYRKLNFVETAVK